MKSLWETAAVDEEALLADDCLNGAANDSDWSSFFVGLFGIDGLNL